MKEKIKKIKVSKEQFADALYIWLSKEWNIEVIKEIAKEFEVKNIKDFIKISKNLPPNLPAGRQGKTCHA